MSSAPHKLWFAVSSTTPGSYKSNVIKKPKDFIPDTNPTLKPRPSQAYLSTKNAAKMKEITGLTATPVPTEAVHRGGEAEASVRWTRRFSAPSSQFLRRKHNTASQVIPTQRLTCYQLLLFTILYNLKGECDTIISFCKT